MAKGFEEGDVSGTQVAAIIVFLIVQFVSAFFAIQIGQEHGPMPGILLFIGILIVSSIILGLIAARTMIYTYEDQERAKKRKH